MFLLMYVSQHHEPTATKAETKQVMVGRLKYVEKGDFFCYGSMRFSMPTLLSRFPMLLVRLFQGQKRLKIAQRRRTSFQEYLKNNPAILHTDAFTSKGRSTLAKARAGRIIMIDDITLGTQTILESKGKKIAALSYASAVSPGGGVLNGCIAQEEALAEAHWDWYLSLCYYYTKKVGAPRHMAAHLFKLYIDVRKQEVLVTQNVKHPGIIGVTLLSAAMPNLNEPFLKEDEVLEYSSFGLRPEMRVDLQNARPGDDVPDYKRIVYNTLKNVIEAAIASGAEVLNIGAFGSGAFKNNPYFVAQIWKDLLIGENYRQYFDKIIFGIPTFGGRNTNNLRAYQKVFEDVIS